MKDKRGIKQKEKELSSPFLLERTLRGVGRKSNSRERKSNLSLDFLAFGSSVRVGPRSKVVLCCKGYAWAPVLWIFDKIREVGVFSYSIILGFKSLVNGLVDLRS